MSPHEAFHTKGRENPGNCAASPSPGGEGRGEGERLPQFHFRSRRLSIFRISGFGFQTELLTIAQWGHERWGETPSSPNFLSLGEIRARRSLAPPGSGKVNSRAQRALAIGQSMVSTPAHKMPNIRREDGCAHTFQPAVDRQYGDWSAARFQNLPRLQPRFQRPHRDGD